ncbi:MAG: DUF4760 domain-containing protein [Pseudolabrys sp.]
MASKPHPKTMQSRFKLHFGKKSYDLLLNVAKVAGAISLIYGVGFGIFQYYETKKEKRIEESLALFRQFNSAPYTDYRKHINILAVDNRKEIEDAASDEKQLTEAIVNIVRREKLEAELAFVLNFYDTVVYCAAKNICDPDIILDLFYPSARELYLPFYQYIQAQQTSFNDFGLGIATLIKLKTATENDQSRPAVAAK